MSESMAQTFDDLYRQRKQQADGVSGFVLWTFLETGTGIPKEHILILGEGDKMKNILTNHNSASLTSMILSIPLGLTFVAFMFEIDQLTKPLTALFTTNGYDLNAPGRLFLIGGLLLLPITFILNLWPILKREGPEGKRKLHTVNLIVGTILLLLLVSTWGGLLLEQIYCLQGIRCD
jgi:hypothetical protein